MQVVILELVRWKLADDAAAAAVRVATLCVICKINSFGRRVIRFIGRYNYLQQTNKFYYSFIL